MKRFSFQGYIIKKIYALVKFPISGLDMSSLMLNSKKKVGMTMKNTKENYLYDLYSVVNHTGTVFSGHYTCYCKSESGKWLYFNDERVYEVNQDIEKEIITNKAYILFYKRNRFRTGNILNTMNVST